MVRVVFLFDISSYTDVELTPYGPLLFTPSLLLSRTQTLVSAVGLQALISLLFDLFHCY